ncbi:MAG: thioredoxin family protein [Alphaproteobacteria bacterium CG_4_10_14_0_8_um_filter_53_9]|nr:MAG: thioredoxin family protein [Alphaproteobacteria bacterium CG_4_10_14_0_8_um_filter_53_9]
MRIWALSAAVVMGAAGTANALTVGENVPADMAFTDHLGKPHTFGEFAGKPLVLEWTNYGCPFVRKHYDSGNMQGLQKKALERGVSWVSVVSSAEGKQGYMTAAEAPAEVAKQGFEGTAVALDSSGEVGRAFGATKTPTMVVVNAEGKIVYHGAVDSIPSFSKEDIAKADNYVAVALDAVAAGTTPEPAMTSAYGCSVKY